MKVRSWSKSDVKRIVFSSVIECSWKKQWIVRSAEEVNIVHKKGSPHQRVIAMADTTVSLELIDLHQLMVLPVTFVLLAHTVLLVLTTPHYVLPEHTTQRQVKIKIHLQHRNYSKEHYNH